jgi:hypothetical protein
VLCVHWWAPLVWHAACDLIRHLRCRYMDSNYVNALSPYDMERERLRRSVLGALRYGKPLVLDLMEVDVWGSMHEQFNAASPGLLPLLISGDVVKEQHYARLVKPGDGDEYALCRFGDDRLQLYRFVVTTTLKFPDETLLGALHVFRIKADA